MSKSALLSVLGLYDWDNTLFDSMEIPSGMDKDTIVNGILQDCAELEILYSNPETLKNMIYIWSKRELPTWERIYHAEQAEYNPIENYDRHQTDTREIEHSGDDVTVGQNTESASGEAGTTTTGTGQVSENNLHKYAAFDAGTLEDQTKDERTGTSSNSQTEQSATTQTSTANLRHTLTHGENVGETFTSYIHGNIGVTTSQQMLESELELAPKINTINYIINSFKMRFCILIY